jgi:hypothetical protein
MLGLGLGLSGGGGDARGRPFSRYFNDGVRRAQECKSLDGSMDVVLIFAIRMRSHRLNSLRSDSFLAVLHSTLCESIRYEWI